MVKLPEAEYQIITEYVVYETRAVRKREQKKRRFKNGQKWRTRV